MRGDLVECAHLLELINPAPEEHVRGQRVGRKPHAVQHHDIQPATRELRGRRAPRATAPDNHNIM